MKSTIAIIPARAGSKGIPGKNSKLLCGIPLIEYTIIEALKSDINKIVVADQNQKLKALNIENEKLLELKTVEYERLVNHKKLEIETPSKHFLPVQ